MKRHLDQLAVTAVSVPRSGLSLATASQVLAVALVLGSAGVQAQTSMRAPPGPEKPATAAGATALPLVDATVERVLRDSGELVLDHGDLPNLAMPAMTMAFDVGTKSMLDAVKPGDKIRFQAEIIDGRPTITHLERVR